MKSAQVKPAPLKIVVHDYSGHAFPVQLSRELARRGHQVLHLYSVSFQTPKGGLSPRPDDPPTLEIRGLTLDRPFAKYDFVRRVAQERAYGRLAAAAIHDFAPQVVISGNSPLDTQAILERRCRRDAIPFIFWLQDVTGIAIRRLLGRRLPGIGAAIGLWYMALERRLLRRSARVVAITEDFVPILTGWGVAGSRIQVIENWAPREELALAPRDNPWAAEHGLKGRTVLLYSGTLGLKHNPALLLDLARGLKHRPEVRVVVISEGLGADWLKESRGDLDNLLLLPYQPYERLSEVLAAADVLVAILEPDAGIFSVPSKVLSYLCAGRPLLAAMPAENLAARIIQREEAGLVAAPDDSAGLLRLAERLVDHPDLRAQCAKNALDYAQQTFDIEAIGARFEALIRPLVPV